MAENVNHDRTRQAQKRDQPEHSPENEKPKFSPGPESLIDGCAGKGGKKCLSENGTEREKKNGNDVFDPAGRHRQRRRHRPAACCDAPDTPKRQSILHDFQVSGLPVYW